MPVCHMLSPVYPHIMVAIPLSRSVRNVLPRLFVNIPIIYSTNLFLAGYIQYIKIPAPTK